MHIEADRLSKAFGALRVLADCSLAVAKGEVVTLLGPSGCGKTTLLRCLAGFHHPDRGEIRIGGRSVTHLPPNRRDVGLVFQNYALFPHLTVAKNVAYGLVVRRRPRAEVSSKVEAALELVSLTPFARRYPASLSGGQQQRVALARALVLEPEVLLLDEPFNALDAKLRGTMQVELRKLIQRLGITSIFVTHDQEEALTLSDRIAVMRSGVIEQVGRPLEIYDHPANAYIADFIGSANVVPIRPGAGLGRLLPELRADRFARGPAILIVRPENLLLHRPGEGVGGMPGRVGFVRPLGPTVEYEIETGLEQPLRALAMRDGGEGRFQAGDEVRVTLKDRDAGVRIVEESPS